MRGEEREGTDGNLLEVEYMEVETLLKVQPLDLIVMLKVLSLCLIVLLDLLLSWLMNVWLNMLVASADSVMQGDLEA